MDLEGIVSKRADAAYAPGNRGLWVKVKCLHRAEFVVVGWTDPEGSRPYLGALLLAYYDPDGWLVYAGRVGTGINQAELERLWRRLQLLATDTMPLAVPPPRSSRFGSPLVLCRVHWVRPELGGRSEISHPDRGQPTLRRVRVLFQRSNNFVFLYGYNRNALTTATPSPLLNRTMDRSALQSKHCEKRAAGTGPKGEALSWPSRGSEIVGFRRQKNIKIGIEPKPLIRQSAT